jgi:predicted nucleotidyltransferase
LVSSGRLGRVELPTLRQRTPKPASRDVARAAVAEAVKAEPAVLAAYLFGSVARGATGPLSDLDVAVLLCDPADDDVVGRLSDALCRRLGTDRVDVISLRRSPVPLCYRVVREGILVFCRDPAARERFTVETVLQYLDFRPLRDRALTLVRGAILGRS